jgi:hypothetical protein
VAHASPVLDPPRRNALARMPKLLVILLVLAVAVAAAVTSYVVAAAKSKGGGSTTHHAAAAGTHAPAAGTTVLSGPPSLVAAGLTRLLFAHAPAVVVSGQGRAALQAAALAARRAHAPLLLTPSAGQAGGPGSTALAAEIKSLDPATVLAVGTSAQAFAARLHGVRVLSAPAALRPAPAPAALGQVAVLVPQGSGSRPAMVTAAIATAQAAGAQVIAVTGADPRADPAAITALASAKPAHVLAIGARFGTARLLAARVAVAETGVQLPGGGQVMFPYRRLVALYGHPGAPALGALGEQDLAASIARVRRVARLYRKLSKVPVVPTFEIIATVAQGSPGPDGLYSYDSPLSLLRPWVRRATAAGMYVVLDLQPGRASLLSQAKLYRPLLRLPNVGLALDPEWKLGPTQLPLQQIGSVGIGEVNAVIGWLARLTAEYHLPQKLLVLHQFRLTMIRNERQLDTRHDDLAIVIHMDGQGTPGDKQQTWHAIVAAAPHGVFFGWKNFYVKDHPMLTPWQTMDHRPQPVMISYQ